MPAASLHATSANAGLFGQKSIAGKNGFGLGLAAQATDQLIDAQIGIVGLYSARCKGGIGSSVHVRGVPIGLRINGDAARVLRALQRANGAQRDFTAIGYQDGGKHGDAFSLSFVERIGRSDFGTLAYFGTPWER